MKQNTIAEVLLLMGNEFNKCNNLNKIIKYYLT